MTPEPRAALRTLASFIMTVQWANGHEWLLTATLKSMYIHLATLTRTYPSLPQCSQQGSTERASKMEHQAVKALKTHQHGSEVLVPYIQRPHRAGRKGHHT